MAKWKNYREKQEQRKEQEKGQDPGSSHAQRAAEEAAKAVAREAAAAAQRAEVNEAASAARAKGISTDGKIVGMQSISPGSSSGWSVPDIGIGENLEADEEDPNRIVSSTASGTGSSSNAGGTSGGVSADGMVIDEKYPEADDILEL